MVANTSENIISQVIALIKAVENTHDVESVALDVKEAVDLFLQIKKQLNGVSPTVWNIVKILL